MPESPGWRPLRGDLGWYERCKRRELEHRIEDASDSVSTGVPKQRGSRASSKRDRLPSSPPSLAIDPLAGLEPRARELDRQHDLGIEL